MSAQHWSEGVHEAFATHRVALVPYSHWNVRPTGGEGGATAELTLVGAGGACQHFSGLVAEVVQPSRLKCPSACAFFIVGGKGARFVVFGTAAEDPEISARQIVDKLQRRGAVAEALPVEHGVVTRWTPAIEALVTPDIDDSLDDFQITCAWVFRSDSSLIYSACWPEPDRMLPPPRAKFSRWPALKRQYCESRAEIDV